MTLEFWIYCAIVASVVFGVLFVICFLALWALILFAVAHWVRRFYFSNYMRLHPKG